MKISIVTTLYHSAPHIGAFCEAVIKTMKTLTEDYEVILVNDGSTDNALAVALALHTQEPRIKIVELSRNFGEHKARMTGLHYASGDLVFLTQADMELSPHCIHDFIQKMQESPDADMVYGIQEKRRGNLHERLRGIVFYTLFNTLSDIKLRPDEVACRLMTRRFVKALLAHKERTILFAGLCMLTGFKQVPCPVIKVRSHKSSYSLRKNLQMTLDAITSFSHFPLTLLFYTGALISVIAAFYIGFVIVRKEMFNVSVSGWTSLIASIWFLGGLTTASIGLVGLYLSRIFLEVKQRPYVIVKDTYGVDVPNQPL